MKKIKGPVNLSNFDVVSRVKNLVPGVLVYKGSKKEEFSIEVIAYNHENLIREEFKTIQDFTVFYDGLKKDQDEKIWINVTGLFAIEAVDAFGEYFNIPKLLLEQVVNITKHSMFKASKDYIFNDLQMIYLSDGSIEVENISIFKTEAYIITFQEKKGDVFNNVRDRITEYQGKIRVNSDGYLYYSLLDALVDNYLDVMEQLKFNINTLEEDIINEEQLDIKDIHNLRKILLFLRLTTMPFEKFLGAERVKKDSIFLDIDPIYIDNLYDHVKESANEVLLQKEMVDALFENYMFNNSNEMNKVMTTLTIFSAILIPLTLLAGIFGMNFKYMPGLDNPNAFNIFMVFGVVLIVSMVGFFKYKKWF